MKIFLCDKGDYKVGIPYGLITIDLTKYDSDENYTNEEYRNEIRKKLYNTFCDLFDPICGFNIWFEDECVECGEKLGTDKNCHNKHCIVNIENNLP